MATDLFHEKYTSLEESGSSLTVKISLFTKLLRDNGLAVTPSEHIDAMNALTLIELSNRSLFYRALKSTLVKHSSDVKLFDELFQAFWLDANESSSDEIRKSNSIEEESPANDPVERDTLEGQFSTIENSKKENEDQRNSRNQKDIAYYSYLATINQKKKESHPLSHNEISSMSRRLGQLILHLKLRPSRRFVFSNDGKIDIKRTLRRNTSTGWEIVNLVRTTAKKKRPDIVLLCDVSGSMSQYNRELELLMLAACSYSPRIHAYCFSTDLEEIDERAVREELARGSINLHDTMDTRIWGSGTRIGEILTLLIEEHSQHLKRSSVVIIVSDGLDCGDTSVLSSKMDELSQRVGRIIWLNPLADSPTFKPITKGMHAALPYVDLMLGFLPLTDKYDAA